MQFNTIAQYNAFNRNETLHPLVSVVNLSKAAPRQLRRMCFGFYVVFLKEIKCGDLKYGISRYDYEEGTLVFLAPGQVIGSAGTDYYQPQGLALVFHADFIHGTPLGRRMNEYTFFSYTANEALHLSEREKQIILDCFSKIEFELERAVDKHSKSLIAANIELLLSYCVRFYDRQFITRVNANTGVLEKFDNLLGNFFASGKPRRLGLPSVAYFAAELNLSANYFGDLVKKETGKSAYEYITLKLIDVAKEKVVGSGKSVSEIAFELGFKYPQHFTRLFKRQVGVTPMAYRRSA